MSNNYHNCIWIAKLSNGEIVEQQLEEKSWSALKRKVEGSNLCIVELCLRFRSNLLSLPSLQPYYYYSKGLTASLTSNDIFYYHVIGCGEDPIKILWVKSPELLVADSKTKSLAECNPECIIKNNHE